MPRSRICGRGAKVLPLHLNTPIGIQRPYSMLSLPNIRSQLFMTVCNLPFAIGAHLDHFLVDDDVVDLDLRPPDSEAQRRFEKRSRFATQKDCVFPAAHRIDHTTVGTAHPNGSALSLDLQKQLTFKGNSLSSSKLKYFVYKASQQSILRLNYQDAGAMSP